MKRKEGESFEDYRKRREEEHSKVKDILAGVFVLITKPFKPPELPSPERETKVPSVFSSKQRRRRKARNKMAAASRRRNRI